MELKRINKLATESELVIAKVERQKRLDHFAGLAMQGIISDSNNQVAPNWAMVSKHSYEIAEAMLKERAKK